MTLSFFIGKVQDDTLSKGALSKRKAIAVLYGTLLLGIHDVLQGIRVDNVNVTLADLHDAVVYKF